MTPENKLEPPLLIGIAEVAHLIGLATRTARRKATAGQLPLPVKIGGTQRWRREEIETWVRAGCPARHRWELVKAGQMQA